MPTTTGGPYPHAEPSPLPLSRRGDLGYCRVAQAARNRLRAPSISRTQPGQVLRAGEALAGGRRRESDARTGIVAAQGGQKTQPPVLDRRCGRDRALDTAGESAVRGAYHQAEAAGTTWALLVPPKNARARVPWKKPEGLSSLDPKFDITRGWPLDTSVGPVASFRGGTNEALRLLQHFIEHGLSTYGTNRTGRSAIR